MANLVPSEINKGTPFFTAQSPGENEDRLKRPLIGSRDGGLQGKFCQQLLKI